MSELCSPWNMTFGCNLIVSALRHRDVHISCRIRDSRRHKLNYYFYFLINHISTAPYGHNFRGAGHEWTPCPGSLLGNGRRESNSRPADKE